VTLLDAKRGRPVRILRILDDRARAQCIRFGIGEGSLVESAERLPLGPVLVQHCSRKSAWVASSPGGSWSKM
jgi:hypothetical protein